MKQLILLIFCLLLCKSVCAQVISPETMDRPHPRLISEDVNLSHLRQQVEISPEIGAAYGRFKEGVENYANQHVSDREWMVYPGDD